MATTTISDLPRDMLVLILRAALESSIDEEYSYLQSRPTGIHAILRRVSREWRDAADIARIEHKKNHVRLEIAYLENPETVRARFPSMVHAITIYRDHPDDCLALTTAQALSSLCASADLRRVLKRVSMDSMCCAGEAAAAVSAIVACPHLTSLNFVWMNPAEDDVELHDLPGDGTLPDVFAPLTALTGLKELKMSLTGAWPALPDIPSLSSLALAGPNFTYVPPVSDASLGHLRRLSLWNYHKLWGDEPFWASKDPLYLRKDLDAGKWRPHLLTNLEELRIRIQRDLPDLSHDASNEQPDEFEGFAPAAAVWAPLAPTVTNLKLDCGESIYDNSDLETGIYAGLGALTGLRALVVKSYRELISPVDFERVHLPHLTFLSAQGYRGPSIDVARFPRLVHVEVVSQETEPLVLSSVAALRGLASLRVSEWHSPYERPGTKPRLNLAELFGGGRPLSALTGLSFERVTLAWDAAAAPGAPAAAEFAARARALLPSLRAVEIKEGVDMEDEVREIVVPAVLALGRG